MSRFACMRVACAALPLALTACASTVATSSLLGGGSGMLAMTPSANIGQTYYLGVFDPREQLPPTIYRIHVQGQASSMSSTQFAAGWVQADLVDSLSGRVSLAKNGDVNLSRGAENSSAKFNEEDKSALNRRLVMFGPEGFREAPRNHRLVIAMGSSPSTFFTAVDQALGVVAQVTQPTTIGSEGTRLLWSELARMRQQDRDLATLLDLAGRP